MVDRESDKNWIKETSFSEFTKGVRAKDPQICVPVSRMIRQIWVVARAIQLRRASHTVRIRSLPLIYS